MLNPPSADLLGCFRAATVREWFIFPVSPQVCLGVFDHLWAGVLSNAPPRFPVLIQTISLPKDLKQGGNCRAYLLKMWKPNIR